MDKRKMSNQCLLIILAGMLWGTQGLFVTEWRSLGLQSKEIAAIRVITATIIFALLVILYNKKLFRIRIQDLWIFVASGLISIVGFTVFYYGAIDMTSVSVAAVLLYVSPAIVSVLSAIFFREKFTKNKVVSLIFAFLGCTFVSGIFENTGTFHAAGVAIGLLAAFCYAMYSIFSALLLRRHYHPMTSMLYTFIIASIGLAMIADWNTLENVLTKDYRRVEFGLLFGCMSCVLPYFLYTISLRYVEVSKAAILSSVEAISASVYSILFLHEAIRIDVIIGIICVILSVVIVNQKKKE